MRIPLQTNRRNRDGSAVIVVIAILSILLIFIAGNIRTLHLLRNDLRFIETQQTNRLATTVLTTTNAALSSSNPPTR